MDIEKTIRQYLPQVVHMSLATSDGSKPWVCEVHFAYDEKLNLYFRSLTTRRHSQEIAKNPNVAGNIVTQHFLGQAVRAVYFEGTAAQVTDDDERQKAFEVMSQRLHFGDEFLAEAERPDGHQFYRISVDTFYLFDSYTSHPSQKYELRWNGGNR
jgi:uncharacterized protein YhbP (UPF0306 family)